MIGVLLVLLIIFARQHPASQPSGHPCIQVPHSATPRHRRGRAATRSCSRSTDDGTYAERTDSRSPRTGWTRGSTLDLRQPSGQAHVRQAGPQPGVPGHHRSDGHRPGGRGAGHQPLTRRRGDGDGQPTPTGPGRSVAGARSRVPALFPHGYRTFRSSDRPLPVTCAHPSLPNLPPPTATPPTFGPGFSVAAPPRPPHPRHRLPWFRNYHLFSAGGIGPGGDREWRGGAGSDILRCRLLPPEARRAGHRPSLPATPRLFPHPPSRRPRSRRRRPAPTPVPHPHGRAAARRAGRRRWRARRPQGGGAGGGNGGGGQGPGPAGVSRTGRSQRGAPPETGAHMLGLEGRPRSSAARSYGPAST